MALPTFCAHFSMKCDHAVQLSSCCICGCTVHTRRLAGGFSPGIRNLPHSEKITIRQGLESAENSNCSSATGFCPTLTTMTKLLASWPAILTQMSAGFPATVCKTSNMFSGQLRSRILRCHLFDVLLSVLFVDCEEYLCILVGFLPGARCAIVCILFSLE